MPVPVGASEQALLLEMVLIQIRILVLISYLILVVLLLHFLVLGLIFVLILVLSHKRFDSLDGVTQNCFRFIHSLHTQTLCTLLHLSVKRNSMK